MVGNTRDFGDVDTACRRSSESSSFDIKMPIYRFHFDTPLSPDEAIARVQAVTGEPGRFGKPICHLGKSSPLFLGNVDHSAFQILRNIQGRNSFLPQIRGRIVPTAAGSRITATMFVHPLPAIFTLFWLSVIGSHARHRAIVDRNYVGAVFLAAMFVFGIALNCVCFFSEARKAHRLLESVVGQVGKRPMD